MTVVKSVILGGAIRFGTTGGAIRFGTTSSSTQIVLIRKFL